MCRLHFHFETVRYICWLDSSLLGEGQDYFGGYFLKWFDACCVSLCCLGNRGLVGLCCLWFCPWARHFTLIDLDGMRGSTRMLFTEVVTNYYKETLSQNFAVCSLGNKHKSILTFLLFVAKALQKMKQTFPYDVSMVAMLKQIVSILSC